MAEVISFITFTLLTALVVAAFGLIPRYFIRNKIVVWGIPFALLAFLSISGGGNVENTLPVLAVATLICFTVDVWWTDRKQKIKKD